MFYNDFNNGEKLLIAFLLTIIIVISMIIISNKDEGVIGEEVGKENSQNITENYYLATQEHTNQGIDIYGTSQINGTSDTSLTSTDNTRKGEVEDNSEIYVLVSGEKLIGVQPFEFSKCPIKNVKAGKNVRINWEGRFEDRKRLFTKSDKAKLYLTVEKVVFIDDRYADWSAEQLVEATLVKKDGGKTHLIYDADIFPNEVAIIFLNDERIIRIFEEEFEGVMHLCLRVVSTKQ